MTADPDNRVSVVIPTHNRAELLMRALESVYAQTRLPDEVIVVDDGSTDDTARQVHGNFPRVRYHYQPNRGVSAARNAGIRCARGQWLAFLDSDDTWQPAKLQRQFHALQQAPGYRLCHSDEIWIRRGRRVNPMKKHAKHGGHIFQHCLALCAISPSSVIVHRSLLDEIGLFDETLPACEDYDLWLRLCAENPVLFVDEPLLVKYGGHADQLSRRYWGMDRFRIRALEKILVTATLSAADRAAALAVLITKIGVYLNGARKRGKWQEAGDYEHKLDHYRRYYAALQADGSHGRAAG